MQPRISVANRPEPLPEPPRPPAERLREFAEEALFQIRRVARESWEDLRRRDRFFQWKAAIVAAWTLCSIVSIRIATATPADPADNGLGAYVALTHTTMSWGLLVENRSDEPWTDVRVILDGGWVHERPLIAAEEKVVLSPSQFLRDGVPAPQDLEVAGLRIETNEGSVTPPVVR